MEDVASRTIAIVGRPNVGKSAIFNRLAKKRMAIVHEESGVTRDRLSTEVVWDDEHFDLIDTGGIGVLLGERIDNTIDEGTRKQVDVALEDASVVIFVVDLTAGIVPMDREVATLLHSCGRKVLLAANKADDDARDGECAVFNELGFSVYPVSALHNRGVGDLVDDAVAALPEVPREVRDAVLKVAITGRPNAGKSSFINRMISSDRVIVSEVAGTTRDSIEVPYTYGHGDSARHYTLIDTAGLRKFGKINDAVERYSSMRAQKSIEHCDICIIMLDATEGPTKQNKRIASLAIEHKKGILIVVSKWDLAEEQGITQRAYTKAMAEELPFLKFAPVVFLSAKTGYNMRKALDAIDYVAGQVASKLSTGLLNRVFQEAQERTQAPVVKGRRLKIYYATQVASKPITIILFVNQPYRLTPAYETFLIARLREAFGLEGAPVVLKIKARPQKEKIG